MSQKLPNTTISQPKTQHKFAQRSKQQRRNRGTRQQYNKKAVQLLQKASQLQGQRGKRPGKNFLQIIQNKLNNGQNLTPLQRKKLQNINSSKPTYQQIKEKYPGIQRLPKIQSMQKGVKDDKDIADMITTAWQYAKQNPRSPQQVFKALQNNQDQALTALYKNLKMYTYSALSRKKLKDAVYGKVRYSVAKKLHVPLHTADILILLDDFVQSDHNQNQHSTDSVSYHVSKNVDHFIPLFQQFVQTSHSSMAPMKYDLLQSNMAVSQDPYSIDINFMKYMFGANVPYPCPRFQNHYMYQMNTRLQVPITTLSDGTALVTIVPASAFAIPTFTANSNYLPFVSVAASSTTNPFLTVPAFSTSPFSGQVQNQTGFAIDSLQLDFVQTEAPIQIKGKNQVAFYYQSPNLSWLRSNTGVYNTNTISISDNQLTNDLGYVYRRSNAQCVKLTRFGTLVPQSSRNAVYPGDLYQNQNNQIFNAMPFIFIKFTGCNASTNIGTLWISVSCSIQPIASLRNILKVTPRGSYQGAFRAFKQCRKQGIPLQFLSAQQAQFLFQDDFRKIRFQRGQVTKQITYGSGKAQIPKGWKLDFDPDQQGYCVNKCLQQLGYQPPCHPYMSYAQATQFNVNTIISYQGNVLDICHRNWNSHQYICFDVKNKHAFIISNSQEQVLTTYVLSQTQIKSLISPHFYNKNLLKGFGGKTVNPLIQVQFQGSQDGFCVSECLHFLKIPHTRTPWMTKQILSQLPANYITLKANRINQIYKCNPKNQFICLDQTNKKSYVVRLKQGLKSLSQLGPFRDNHNLVQFQVHSLACRQSPLFAQVVQTPYPINLTKLPKIVIDYFIKQNIIVNQQCLYQRPLIPINFNCFQQNVKYNCPKGQFCLIDQYLLIQVQGEKSAVFKPNVFEAQKLTGLLFDMKGQLLKQDLVLPVLIHTCGKNLNNALGTILYQQVSKFVYDQPKQSITSQSKRTQDMILMELAQLVKKNKAL